MAGLRRDAGRGDRDNPEIRKGAAQGDFFALLDQKVPGLAMILAGLKQAPPVQPPEKPATQAAISTEPSSSRLRKFGLSLV